jgi:hypothetical protein
MEAFAGKKRSERVGSLGGGEFISKGARQRGVIFSQKLL